MHPCYREVAWQYSNNTIDQLLGLLNSCIKACGEHTSAAWNSLNSQGFIEDQQFFAVLFFVCLMYGWPQVLAAELQHFSILAGPDTMQRVVLKCFCICKSFDLHIWSRFVSPELSGVRVSNFSYHVKKWFDSGKIRPAEYETDTSN